MLRRQHMLHLGAASTWDSDGRPEPTGMMVSSGCVNELFTPLKVQLLNSD